MEALADRFRSRGIDVALRVDLDFEAGRAPTRHDDELETALYRITQEAMTNALKHSGAESLSVEIVEADGHIDSVSATRVEATTRPSTPAASGCSGCASASSCSADG